MTAALDVRSSAASGRLVAKVVPVSALDSSAIEAMWSLFARYYASVTRDRFERDLTAKNDVIMLVDDGDGSIQGFSTIQVYERRHEGRRFVAVFSGDTIIDEAYWGQSALHRAFVRYVVRLKLSRPFTPVYWFLISKGYKTYLLLSRNFTSYWPRHDRATPNWEQTLIDMLAADKYPEAYVADRGVLHFSECEGRLKRAVAPIDPSVLSAPDVRFFVDQNPGHVDGDELCCLGKVDFGLWSHFTLRLLRKAWLRGGNAARRLWAAATAVF